MVQNLPIDSYIPQILESRHHSQVIVASPGSGKTTRIPPAIAKESEKKVLCVEPRRLACVAAASRIAEEQGWNLGKEVGYHVRLDRKCTDSTKLVFVTNGMLLQYLCADPFLENVSAVIFDEFHERSIDADIALAMVRYIQKEVRDDLHIVVMSATLETDALGRWLGDAYILKVDSPIYPLEIRYTDRAYSSRISEYMDELMFQCKQVMQSIDGDCLVFLPGVGDIHAAIDRASYEFGDRYELEECHASLPLDQQRRILLPKTSKQRIIFSTNVAESSLTVPRVRAVIDSGHAKRKFFDSVSGLSRLETLRISKASADQRAGRAARLGPGICVRLWNDQVQNQLELQTAPEIDHLDLSQAWLQIASWGIETPGELDLLTRPASGRLSDAKSLLIRLAAVDENGEITELGRTMSRLPVEPRLARWLMAAEEHGCLDDTALLAAYLSEAPYRRSQRDNWPGTNLYIDFLKLKKEIKKPENTIIRRSAEDILDTFKKNHSVKNGSGNNHKEHQANGDYIESLRQSLVVSMLAAYPDRLAQPRNNNKEKDKLSASDPRRNVIPINALMSGNRGVILKDPYELKDTKFFICADLDLVRGRERAENNVVKAMDVKSEWLPWKEEIVARYEPDKDRVVIANSVHFDIFILRETFLHDAKYRKLEEKTLLNAALNTPNKVFNFKTDVWLQFEARLSFVRKLMPEMEFPTFDESWAKTVLPELVKKCSNFEDLRSIDLTQYANQALDYETQTLLGKLAPRRVKLENDYETDVDYTLDPPVIRVKIQKAFGVYHLPKIGGNKVMVMMHLCAPNGRPAQVTQDMESFWHHTYADVRKQLRGRYPKHDWPEKAP